MDDTKRAERRYAERKCKAGITMAAPLGQNVSRTPAQPPVCGKRQGRD
jgi:hypothetical protein